MVARRKAILPMQVDDDGGSTDNATIGIEGVCWWEEVEVKQQSKDYNIKP